MALALRIFKAEKVGFVQLQRLFPEIMTQLLKKKSIILILSSFVWELFSLFTEPSTPGRVSGSAFSESCWLCAQCLFYWALLATMSISEVAWSQVRRSEAHDPLPGKGWSWATISCGGVHVIYRFSSWVEEWRIGNWICCTICSDAGSVLVCYGEERAECEGEAVSLISPSTSCCHDWALFIQVRNVVIRVHSSTASWGEWASDYDAIRSPPRWRRFGHIQQGESQGHIGNIVSQLAWECLRKRIRRWFREEGNWVDGWMNISTTLMRVDGITAQVRGASLMFTSCYLSQAHASRWGWM